MGGASGPGFGAAPQRLPRRLRRSIAPTVRQEACSAAAPMTPTTVPLVLLLVFYSVAVLATPSLSGNKFGSLTLCPAGGRSFAMAWSLACEMKRRKRSSGFERRSKMRPATIKEMQKICCVAGCELRDLISYCDPFGGWSN